MRNNICFLIRSFFIALLFFLLFPLLSFTQSLAPIPDVGPGVCVSNCGHTTPSTFPSPTFTPSEDTSPSPIPTPPPIVTKLQTAKELNKQAQKELQEGEYVKASTTINDTIQSLSDAKDTFETDLKSITCKNKSQAAKYERSIESSINNHQKAASIVDRIIEETSSPNRTNNVLRVNEDEGLLQKLIRIANRLLTRRMPRPARTNAVCGVRG